MRYLLLLIILVTGSSFAVSQSRVDMNYVDTTYSALLAPISARQISYKNDIYNHVALGWTLYKVNAKVIDSYKGSLEQGSQIDILIQLSAFNKKGLDQFDTEFILSFCQSDTGVYYNNQDWFVIETSDKHKDMFKHVMKNGTEYTGPGDCSSLRTHLIPDQDVAHFFKKF